MCTDKRRSSGSERAIFGILTRWSRDDQQNSSASSRGSRTLGFQARRGRPRLRRANKEQRLGCSIDRETDNVGLCNILANRGIGPILVARY